MKFGKHTLYHVRNTS